MWFQGGVIVIVGARKGDAALSAKCVIAVFASQELDYLQSAGRVRSAQQLLADPSEHRKGNNDGRYVDFISGNRGKIPYGDTIPTSLPRVLE